MSRVGKMPIPIPDGVTLTLQGSTVAAKGPLGELSYRLPHGASVKIADGVARVEMAGPAKRSAPMHGVTRAMVANIVEGVSKGYRKELEIIGTGYRVSLEGSTLVLKLNYDHPIRFPLPDGITAQVTERPPKITIIGINKALVGQVAADLRGLQPPEPYKGKGVKYAGEVIRRKAGKSAG